MTRAWVAAGMTVQAVLGTAAGAYAASGEHRAAAIAGTDITVGKQSWPWAVNTAGEVVGGYSFANDTHGFVWHNGVFTDIIPLHGGTYSLAEAVNEAGDVVGRSGNYGDSHPFSWHNGVSVELPALGGTGSADALNDHGVIAGMAFQPSTGTNKAVLWCDGALTVLPDLGGTYSSAGPVNESGQVLIYTVAPSGVQHALFWSAGVMTDLGPGVPAGLNDAGQALVGSVQSDQGPTRPFLWRAGQKTYLPAGVTSVAGLNQSGQVVGQYTVAGTGASDGFLWDGRTLTDLGSISPVGINEYGQVIASSPAGTVVWYQGHVTTLTPQTGPAGPPVISDGGLVASEVYSTGDTDVWQVPRS
ncbi:MAG: hypothetical protein JF587_10025 [Catenulisporales bacterium]|nr:hypothetical protein [Catenulisporales bacterium]